MLLYFLLLDPNVMLFTLYLSRLRSVKVSTLIKRMSWFLLVSSALCPTAIFLTLGLWKTKCVLGFYPLLFFEKLLMEVVAPLLLFDAILSFLFPYCFLSSSFPSFFLFIPFLPYHLFLSRESIENNISTHMIVIMSVYTLSCSDSTCENALGILLLLIILSK